MSIRSTASCCQPLQDSSVPRGARTRRAPGSGGFMAAIGSWQPQALEQLLAEAAVTDRRRGDQDVLVLEPHVVGVHARDAARDVRLAIRDDGLRVADHAARAGARTLVVG